MCSASGSGPEDWEPQHTPSDEADEPTATADKPDPLRSGPAANSSLDPFGSDAMQQPLQGQAAADFSMSPDDVQRSMEAPEDAGHTTD